jgi:YVTN family beta-propeller protein
VVRAPASVQSEHAVAGPHTVRLPANEPSRNIRSALASQPALNETLVLENNTLVPGNFLAGSGTDPLGVVYDYRHGEFYVADGGSNNLAVVSDTTDRVTNLITVGAEPVGLAYDSGKGEIFVVNHNGGTVSVVSDSTQSVVATVLAGTSPLGVAYDGSTGEVFVSCWNTSSYTGTVSVISDSTDRIVATIPVGSYPSGLAYDSGKGEVFVANQNPGYALGTVSVISDSTDAVVATIPAGPTPFAVAYDPVLGEIFVTNAGSAPDGLSVISDSSNTVVAKVAMPAAPQGITFDSASNQVFAVSPGSCFFTCSAGSVTVIAAATNTVVVHFAVPVGAPGVAYDNDTDQLLVPNSGGGCSSFFGLTVGCSLASVSIVSDGTDSIVATVPLQSGPTAVVYDVGAGEVFAADQYASAVDVISAVTNEVVGTIPVAFVPESLAYDSGKGDVFVAGGSAFSNGNVSVISDVSNTVVATISVGEYPLAMAYDPGKGEVFVVNNVGSTVSIISDATNSVVRTVPVSSSPSAAVYDPGRGEVFIASQQLCGYSFCGTVDVISDSNDSVVSSVAVGGAPTGLAYDNASGEIFVSDEFEATQVISDSSDRVEASIAAVSDTQSIAYDPSTGLIFAADSFDSQVVAFVAGARAVVAELAGGADPVSLAVNPATGAIYAANSKQGTISIYSAGSTVYPGVYYPVTFVARGLPRGTTWSVTAGGFVGIQSSAEPNLTIREPAGPFNFSLDSSGFGVARIVGPNALTVTSGLVTGAVTWTAWFGRLENLTFVANQTGFELYPGASWAIDLNATLPHGGPTSLRAASSSSRITFVVPRGSVWRFQVSAPTLYRIVASPYAVVIPGHAVVLKVRFVLITGTLRFVESGLRGPTSWNITLTGATGPAASWFAQMYPHGITLSSARGAIAFQLPTGNYTWEVSSPAVQTPSPASGTATVSASTLQIVRLAWT